MGLLDDAIREHLDLKRQRGADPAEIERMEREALGPVRREPTLGSDRFEALDEHAPHAYEHEYPEEHLTELEELQEHGYHDSTAPHPHPHHEHDHPHREHAGPYEDFDAEHARPDALEPLTEHMQVPVEESEQPRRRFLRRNRPASLSEHDAPEPGFHEQAPLPRPEDLHRHADLDEPGMAAAPAPQPASPAPHPAAPHVPAPQPAAEEPPEPQHASPEARAPQSGPPHLRFEHPPRRPRFTAEPPAPQPEEEGEPAPAGEARGEAPAPAPANPAHPELQETTEFDVQQHLEQPQAPAAQPADEDVLEETPEFLQDTPEHDRLWFEQRPPRDFDFDG